MKVNHFFFFSFNSDRTKKCVEPSDQSFHPFFHFLLPLVQYNQLKEQLSIYQGFFFFFLRFSKISTKENMRERKFSRKLVVFMIFFPFTFMINLIMNLMIGPHQKDEKTKHHSLYIENT